MLKGINQWTLYALSSMLINMYNAPLIPSFTQLAQHFMTLNPAPSRCPRPLTVFSPLPVPRFVFYQPLASAQRSFVSIDGPGKVKAEEETEREENIRSIRLKRVSHNPQSQASKEPPNPKPLPPLLLILFTRLHTEQPSTGGIIMVLMCVVCCGKL